MVALQVTRQNQPTSEVSLSLLANLLDRRAALGVGLVAGAEMGQHQVGNARRLGETRHRGSRTVPITGPGVIDDRLGKGRLMHKHIRTRCHVGQ
ncbi:hypothetical protein D3C78_1629860 [compost metagenome]